MKCKIRILFVVLLLIMIQPIFAQTGLDTTKKGIQKRIWEVPATAMKQTNPFAYNVAVTDTGKKYYNLYCIVCHGKKGFGDGVAAPGLSIHPANHAAPEVQSQTNGSLYFKITNGYAPMPSFKNVLTNKQRWACVNYIRTLKAPPPKK